MRTALYDLYLAIGIWFIGRVSSIRAADLLIEWGENKKRYAQRHL